MHIIMNISIFVFVLFKKKYICTKHPVSLMVIDAMHKPLCQARLSFVCSRRAIETYTRRIKWLLQGSRKVIFVLLDLYLLDEILFCVHLTAYHVHLTAMTT